MAATKLRNAAVSGLVERVTAELFPSEMRIFNIIGSRVLELVANGQNPRTALSVGSDSQRAEFGSSEALQIVSFVGVAIGTYKAYLEIKKIKQTERRAILAAQQWKQELVTAGLEPEVAQRVVERFANDLSKL